jgi:putative transposase
VCCDHTRERLDREIKQRTDVVGVFPNRAAVVRLFSALLAEQNHERLVTKHSVSAESMQALRRPRDQPEQLQVDVPAA